MSTTALLSVFSAGCSLWAIMGPALCSKQVDVSDHPQLDNNIWIQGTSTHMEGGSCFFSHYSASLLCLAKNALNTFPLLIQLPK